MNIGQLISGLVLITGGIALIVVALVNGFRDGSFLAMIYGVPAFILGIFILLNKKEDYVEPVKTKSKKEVKK